MILMLVKDATEQTPALRRHLSPSGISVVQYRHPLKALDNLEEVRPALVLYDWQDFPRHWKILAKYLRGDFGKDEVVFLLVSEAAAPLEEANKALFLGVNALLRDPGDPAALARNVREVYLRYGSLEVEVAETEGPLPFLFRHPRGKNLVTGSLVHFDGSKATFRADFPHEIADLSEGETLSRGSLRLADSVRELDALIVQNNGQLRLTVNP